MDRGALVSVMRHTVTLSFMWPHCLCHILSHPKSSSSFLTLHALTAYNIGGRGDLLFPWQQCSAEGPDEIQTKIKVSQQSLRPAHCLWTRMTVQDEVKDEARPPGIQLIQTETRPGPPAPPPPSVVPLHIFVSPDINNSITFRNRDFLKFTAASLAGQTQTLDFTSKLQQMQHDVEFVWR